MSRKPFLILLAALLILMPALTGCGGGESEEAATTEQAAPAAEETAPAATVATHDCDGGCGMTAVPEDQLTEIDGKWYCAGCAAKAAKSTDHSG
jgi:hypothetical protein